MAALKLRNCPFCGDKHPSVGTCEGFNYRDEYYIWCSDCLCRTGNCSSIEEAAEDWNRRADDKVGAGMTLGEAIGYIHSLCDAISDQPCGCDACPYGDTFDDDEICDVMRAINKGDE